MGPDPAVGRQRRSAGKRAREDRVKPGRTMKNLKPVGTRRTQGFAHNLFFSDTAGGKDWRPQCR